jgi:alpha-glucoside transport system permease protein
MTALPEQRSPHSLTIMDRLETLLTKAPVHIVVIAIAVLWTLPTAGLLISSFRQPDALLETGWWTVLTPPLEPGQFHLGNYTDVLTGQGMGQAFLNSLIITIPATVMPIAIATFAAYALAWMRFPGRQMLFVMIVGLLVVPLQMTLIPVLRAYNSLGLAGTFLGVWLAHTGYGMPLGIYLLRNYIGTLPRDLIEAAAVDGASHLKIFHAHCGAAVDPRDRLLCRLSSSSGCGMTCWWRWCTSGVTRTSLP